MIKLNTYFHVTDGVVDEGPKLMWGPWANAVTNASNLECYSDEELAAFGWYPAWDAQSVAAPGQKLSEPIRTFDEEGARVVISHNSVPIPDPEFNHGIAEQIKSADATRDNALTTGVLHAGKRWHVDTVFAIHLMAMLQAYDNGIVPANSRQPIRTLDNTVEMLLRQEIVALAAVVMGRQQQIYGQSWATKDALRAQLRT